MNKKAQFSTTRKIIFHLVIVLIVLALFIIFVILPRFGKGIDIIKLISGMFY